MQTVKETAANVAAAARSGVENTKAAVGEKEGGGEEKPAAVAGGTYSYSAATGEEGQSTGGRQMSALPGHGKGEPAGQVVEGTIKSHPIGRATGTGRPTAAHNTRAGGAANEGYGTGGGYSG